MKKKGARGEPYASNLCLPKPFDVHEIEAALDRQRSGLVGLWRGFLSFLPGNAAPVLDLDRRRLVQGLSCVLLVAAVAQALLLGSGLYTISNDESERALLAHGLNWANIFAPSWWPPLTKVLMGLALRLYDDLFVMPRLEVGIAGLICLCALAFLAFRLFNNRLVALLAAALGIFLPQRWLLSVVPLSDIFGYTFILFAAGFIAGWMKTARSADLTAGSVFLMLACAVRLEVWFIAAAWGLYLAYASLIRRQVSLSLLALNGLIISVFPIFWLAHNYLLTGSFDNFSIVSRQFVDFYGRDLVTALRNNILYRLGRDVALNPALTLGAAGLVYWAVYKGEIRAWLLVFFVPVLVEAVDMLATYSVPIGEGMRSDGIWALLLLPFAAAAIVTIAEHVTQKAMVRRVVIAMLLYGLAVSLIVYTQLQRKIFEDVGVVLSQTDLSLGKYLRTLLSDGKQTVLLDATDGLDYLNVLVTSNAPERFVLNVDTDPVETALYAGAPIESLRHYDHAVIEKYRTDKFWTGDNLDSQKLNARGITYILARRPGYVLALDQHPEQLRRVRNFGSWVLFKRGDLP